MIREVIKRFLTLTLCVLMLCAVIPINAVKAYAATSLAVPVADLGVAFDGAESGIWSVQGNEITGTVEATTGCSTSAATTTLTLTNQKNTAATLAFDYEISIVGGTITVDGNSVTANASFNKTIDAGSTIKIVLTSSATANQITKIVLKNTQLYDPKATAAVTFLPATGGRYTIDGAEITEKTTKENAAEYGYEMVATPDAGYRFFGWFSDETKISANPKTIMHFDKNMNITAKFVDASAPIFEVEGKQFIDLNEAGTYALSDAVQAKTIVLVENGTLKGGNYTIPSGVTLLIPFDAKYTLYTTAPDSVKTAEPQSAFKTLTLTNGATIEVDGSVSVGGKCYTSSSTTVCKPTGAYGLVQLEDESSINLNSGANLYAWGYVTGNGKVYAKSGANVYEFFQIMDWRGGTATSNFKDNENKVFPFSQYYVQNVEAPITYEKGANETVRITVTAGGISASAEVSFMGEAGMFQLEEGSTVTKRYDSATDRLIFDMNGDAKLNGIAMNNLPVIGTFNSNVYVLPINNNMTMKIHSGTMTLNQDTALLPGVQIIVDKNAKLKVAEGMSLYIYDTAQWSNTYVWGSNAQGIQQVAFSPSGRQSRQISDAEIDINGTVIADGNVYTTQDGAKICSSAGTGVFVQKTESNLSAKTYQASQDSSGNPIYYEIPITPASLHNANDTYTETAKASAGTQFWYRDGMWGSEGLTKVSNADGNRDHNFYYYFDENGEMVKNIPLGGKDYWVEKTNDLLPQWGYYFDENGVILHDDAFQNGIQEDGYYYIDGIKVHQGLFKVDEDYYYARSSGALVKGQWYYCERMNGLYPEGNYHFDTDGKMFTGSGIVEKDGSLYYYVNGLRTYAGLIEIDGSYYYVKTNGEVVHGKNYWITKTNGLMPEKSYRFADDGTIENPEIKDISKSGIVEENGSLYYYVDGLKNYAGLIEIDGAYYYVRTSGEVVHGQKYWITKTNGLMKESSYTFADDGKMIL